MNASQVLVLALGLLGLIITSLYVPYRVEVYTVTARGMDAEPQSERRYAPVWNAPERGYDSATKAHIRSVELDVGRLLATYAIILPVTILLYAAGYGAGANPSLRT